MEWSPQQSAALKSASAWLNNKRSPQVFKLMGFAGTGKTTMAKELAAEVDGTSLFGAFTGKAALVLRKKGNEASTLHSLIYKAIEDPVTGDVEFKINHESPLSYAHLLVVDEVSMVDEALGRDLLSFGCKVLVLGDPFQLPPVGGGGFFTNGTPDVMLTEIHRQAADNPIIRMSMDLREGRGLQLGNYGDSRVLARDGISREELAADVLAADQVLCGRNKTRQTMNQRIRQLRGYVGQWPNKGERLVCLRNNKLKGLLNGGLWEVKESQARSRSVRMMLDSLDDSLRDIEVDTLNEFFMGTEGGLDWKEKKKFDEFTFGYALTCHKAQGSQWDNVLVFDEGSAFGERAARWSYTAVTRAAERVTVIV